MTTTQEFRDTFVQGVISEHTAAAEDGSNFVCHWEDYEERNRPQDRPPVHDRRNCIAYAINIEDQALTPSSLDDLTFAYNARGYFEVTDAVRKNDVEVYAAGINPLHAHKIVNVADGSCESKMGNGPVITHPRNMLESPMRNGSGQRKYGRIVMRFRQDNKEYDTWYKNTYDITASGRAVPKRKAGSKSGSGRPVVEKQKNKTSSGRVKKTPGRYNSKKGGRFSRFFRALFGRRKEKTRK